MGQRYTVVSEAVKPSAIWLTTYLLPTCCVHPVRARVWSGSESGSKGRLHSLNRLHRWFLPLLLPIPLTTQSTQGWASHRAGNTGNSNSQLATIWNPNILCYVWDIFTTRKAGAGIRKCTASSTLPPSSRRFSRKRVLINAVFPWIDTSTIVEHNKLHLTNSFCSRTHMAQMYTTPSDKQLYTNCCLGSRLFADSRVSPSRLLRDFDLDLLLLASRSLLLLLDELLVASRPHFSSAE